MKAHEAKKMAESYKVDLSKSFKAIELAAKHGQFVTVLRQGMDDLTYGRTYEIEYWENLSDVVKALTENGYTVEVTSGSTVKVSWK